MLEEGQLEMKSNMNSDLNSNPKSNFNTDGRTDERDEDELAADLLATTPNARRGRGLRALTARELLDEADVDDTSTLIPGQLRVLHSLLESRNRRFDRQAGVRTVAQVMQDWGNDPSTSQMQGKRWPVIRRGERESIPSALRFSIYRRDFQTCKTCGMGEAFDLDHCVPWSAGGPDDSDNLRVLCQGCNQRRSNYVDFAHLTNYRPTTWWCMDCWASDEDGRPPRYRLPWRDHTDLSKVPAITEDDGPCELVFCAWCQHYSMSPLFFVGERGRDLLAAIGPTPVTA